VVALAVVAPAVVAAAVVAPAAGVDQWLPPVVPAGAGVVVTLPLPCAVESKLVVASTGVVVTTFGAGVVGATGVVVTTFGAGVVVTLPLP